MHESLAARFARIAAGHRDRPAIVTTRATRTYGELDATSARIAHALLAAGGPGVESVAVLLDGDVEAAETFVGAFRAGKRYVPIDPRLPDARAATILEDCQARIVLTDAVHLPRAVALAPAGVHVADVTALDRAWPDTLPPAAIDPDTDVWIVYTSGSTGQPKGLVQTHRNLMQYLWVYASGFRMTPEDRLTSLFSLAVNGGLHDLLISLSTGGSFCPWHPARDGVAGVGAWLRAQRSTVYSSVPTVFRNVTAAFAPGERMPDVRLVRLWGEASHRRDFEAFCRHFPNARLVNRLGSSETGPLRWIFLDHASTFEGNRVPVGWNAPDVEVLLVDADGREVAPGEIGELVARSRYLSPGYWRRPSLTAAAFSVDPDDPALRRYRTGDLARMLPDGNCVPMGRKDSQVKIRGHRVELDEIEQALLRHPGVSEAVVTGVADDADEVRLVAYVVPRPGTPPTVTSLRRALAAVLPTAMMPTAFVQLATLPQAPNGKVNRRALPRPGTARPDLEAAYRDAGGRRGAEHRAARGRRCSGSTRWERTTRSSTWAATRSGPHA